MIRKLLVPAIIAVVAFTGGCAGDSESPSTQTGEGAVPTANIVTKPGTRYPDLTFAVGCTKEQLDGFQERIDATDVTYISKKDRAGAPYTQAQLSTFLGCVYFYHEGQRADGGSEYAYMTPNFGFVYDERLIKGKTAAQKKASADAMATSGLVPAQPVKGYEGKLWRTKNTRLIGCSAEKQRCLNVTIATNPVSLAAGEPLDQHIERLVREYAGIK